MHIISMASGITQRTTVPEEDAFMQVYRPLYENSYAHRNGGLFDLRPLQMFYEPAIKDDRPVARFTKITDPNIIAELREIKSRMYPDP